MGNHHHFEKVVFRGAGIAVRKTIVEVVVAVVVVRVTRLSHAVEYHQAGQNLLHLVSHRCHALDAQLTLVVEVVGLR